MGYRTVQFHASDRDGKPVYHTNVLMAIGTTVAVVCVEMIRSEVERNAVLQTLGATFVVVVSIGLPFICRQVSHHCADHRGSSAFILWQRIGASPFAKWRDISHIGHVKHCLQWLH